MPAQSSFSWRVNAPQLSLAVNADGGVDFTDASGAVRFRIPTPLMWDSGGTDGVSSAAMVNVPVSVARSGDAWVVTLTPSRTWLNDPARVYPVSLDPSTWSGGPQDIHAYKSDGTLRTDTMLIGNARDPGDHYWRTIAHYPYEQLFGKQILDAWLTVAQNAGPGNGTSRTGGVYWASAFGFAGNGPYLAPLTVTTSGASSGTGVAAQIASWVYAGSSGNYLMVTGQESPGVYTLKSLNSSLFISWVDRPSVPVATGASPTGGARASLTPTLQVSSSDPTGTGLSYYYRVATGSNAESGVVWNSGWTASSSVTVPAGVLQPGTTYYYHLYAHSGYCFSTPSNSCDQPFSQVYSFVTNTPGVIAQSSASPVDGQVLVSPTPTLQTGPGTDANGDTLKYQFRVATGSDGATGVVAMSPVITSGPVAWTVPAGVLQDGVTYSWVVIVDDGYDKSTGTWVNHFRYTSRTGTATPSPSDGAGGVGVNLANGNVNVSFASPTVSTLAGRWACRSPTTRSSHRPRA